MLIILYICLGYWATGKTIYANKIVIHQLGELFISRIIFGTLFGWFLIPVALFKTIFRF